MRGFLQGEIVAAIEYAKAGGSALHLHTLGTDKPGAPVVFKRAVASGQWIAHLFDRDRDRLIATARQLGVRTVYIHRDRTDRAHVDLCAGPLLRALALCENVADLPTTPPRLAGAEPDRLPAETKPAPPTLFGLPLVESADVPAGGDIRFGNLSGFPYTRTQAVPLPPGTTMRIVDGGADGEAASGG